MADSDIVASVQSDIATMTLAGHRSVSLSGSQLIYSPSSDRVDLISCTESILAPSSFGLSMSDANDLAWLCVGVLVAAFAVNSLKEALK